MILIADSGSTKTEWSVLEGNIRKGSYLSAGINPFFMSSEMIVSSLKEELTILEKQDFGKIYFYGTGCSSDERKKTVRNALSDFFSAIEIFSEPDLLGAARSLCQNEPGIACIIGTGSNSCYYDGKAIKANVAPLGYILGDEGGAAVLGRKLLSLVLKKQVSAKVAEVFFSTYSMTPQEILENVYMKPFPNRFLGQFARFLYDHTDMPEIMAIITTSFDEFIRRNILQYPEARSLPVHFTGSIAWHFSHYLENELIRNDLKPGIISLSPMERLVRFHIKNENPELYG